MERRGRGKHRPLVREAARERIDTLYRLAFEKAGKGELELSRRYLKLAHKIGMRYTVRVPPYLKRVTCRECMTPLISGRTSRVRNRDGRMVVTCLSCGSVKRYPFRGRTAREHDVEE